MPQPRFEELRERLLQAGIAPRHVRRYLRELTDHYDDLVRESLANGAPPGTAEASARQRLGNDRDLAGVMLARPDVRSLASRFPWLVFGIGPFALSLAVLVAGVAAEVAVFEIVGVFFNNPTHVPPPAWFVNSVNAWNWVVTHALPLAVAAGLVAVSVRQRMKPGWMIFAVGVVCVLGGFQDLMWSDNGVHGELELNSGLALPFHRDLFVAGVWRAIINLALVSAAWFAVMRAHILAENPGLAREA